MVLDTTYKFQTMKFVILNNLYLHNWFCTTDNIFLMQYNRQYYNFIFCCILFMCVQWTVSYHIYGPSCTYVDMLDIGWDHATDVGWGILWTHAHFTEGRKVIASSANKKERLWYHIVELPATPHPCFSFGEQHDLFLHCEGPISLHIYTYSPTGGKYLQSIRSIINLFVTVSTCIIYIYIYIYISCLTIIM